MATFFGGWTIFAASGDKNCHTARVVLTKNGAGTGF
jgi:hypothetical protein